MGIDAYGVAVIGAGPAGSVAAIAACRAGARMVEPGLADGLLDVRTIGHIMARMTPWRTVTA